MSQETSDKRLKILGADEIESIYARPLFSIEEQELYFSLSSEEKAALEQLHSIKSRLFFILQFGYFKARHQFFNFSLEEVENDARYIQRVYFPDATLSNIRIVKKTRHKQQRMILALFDFRHCREPERKNLEEKARELAKICCKPIYIFRELVEFLTQQRIVLPGYSWMQELIGRTLLQEQARLTVILRTELTQQTIIDLEALLENPDGLYEITRLKHEPKDFSIKEMACELARKEQMQALYDVAQSLLPRFDISNESVKYYASLVNYYSVYKLRQLTDEQLVYIYLLCFVFHRYQRVYDNLLTCLLFQVQLFHAEAKSAAKERVYELSVEKNRNLRKAGEVLKLFVDESISKDTPYQEVQAKAFEILEPKELADVAEYIIESPQFDETAFYWEHVEQMAHRLKLRLRPLLRSIEFSSTSPDEALFEALDFLKEAFGKDKALTQFNLDDFPKRFIPESVRPYLYMKEEGQKYLLVERYEFFVSRCLRERIEAGDIFCSESMRFRSFEDDLLSHQQWQKKDALFETIGFSILREPIAEHLASLEQVLEERLVSVNQRILSGVNEQVQIKRRNQKTHWTLPYPKANESMNHPFFDALQQVNIQAVLAFAHRECQLMDCFTHILPRNARREADDAALIACLLAWGTNMGLGRMAETSDLEYTTLSSTSNNFLRLETLQQANERVSDAISRLPIFRHYHLDGTIHSSSDGQKFETTIHTINARYSPKYFGLKKGVVSYTLVANHVPINARIIGANEHESHYVFDLLFNNTTEIQPTIHSTDTHGTNEVNFALLHFFGYQFAPRYRNIQEKIANGLYGFEHPDQYDEEWLLKPRRKLKTRLIIDEWENLQRIIASLALKTTTQSIIVSKLSSYARRNRTRQALWEYDNIIRSIYLLDYIDSLSLRRNVQHALNRGENYHKLRRAVSYANFGKLRFKTEHEQQIWNECSRLLTNCIILYNATLLSKLLALKEEKEEFEQAALFQRLSPVAWQHINFYGHYEFIRALEPLDVEAMARELSTLSVKIGEPENLEYPFSGE